MVIVSQANIFERENEVIASVVTDLLIPLLSETNISWARYQVLASVGSDTVKYASHYMS